MARILRGHNFAQGGHLLLGHGSGAASVGIEAYTLAGISPSYVNDTRARFYYATGTTYDGPNQMHTHATAGRRTVVDSDGVRKWAPHNLLLSSEDFASASWGKLGTIPPTVSAGFQTAPDGTATARRVTFGASTDSKIEQTVNFTVTGRAYTTGVWMRHVSGGTTLRVGTSGVVVGEFSEVTVTSDWQFFDHESIASGTSEFPQVRAINGDAPVVDMWHPRFHASSLDGVQSTGNGLDPYYVPTTTGRSFWTGIDHDPVTGQPKGYSGEPDATQLLLNTETLSTQSVAVSAQAYTLHFTGTGTVTLSGASTAGPLVGTGTGESNRVSLTFTPSAGTLTLTVSGTVTRAQLEAGSLVTSYIPAVGATVTRAASAVSKPIGEVFPLGAELVANVGNPFVDTTDWVNANNSLISASSGELVITHNGTANPGAQGNTGAYTAGKLYRVEFTVGSFDGSGIEAYIGSSGSGILGLGTHIVYLTPSSSGSNIQLIAWGTTGTASFSNVSVKEVQQTEIVAVMEFECAAVAVDAVIAALDNAGTDLIHFRAHTSQANLFVQDGGVTQADIDAGAIAADTTYRAAFKIAANDFQAIVAGSAGTPDTSGTMPSPTALRLFNASGASPLTPIKIKKLVLYGGVAGSMDAITEAVLEAA